MSLEKKNVQRNKHRFDSLVLACNVQVDMTAFSLVKWP